MSTRLLDDQAHVHWAEFVGNIVRYVTVLTIPMIPVTAILWLVFRQYAQLPIISVVSALFVLSGYLYPVLSRRGHEIAGVRFFLVSFWAVVTTCTLLLPQVGLVAVIA